MTDTCKVILKELGVVCEINNGNRVVLSNGSKLNAQSASENTKVEGESYHVLVLDEAQDISILKIRKSLHPMVSA
ncbi:hypothetical protein, partial [Bacillus subtilis]|uniref:hypothetical protein n=1 Tax=Bacillus subtilis TaxID=1423 RepID=UPI003C13A62B